MIRVRRVSSSLPLVRMYELDLNGNRMKVRRGRAVRKLEEVVGVGDAWSFINAADASTGEGDRRWAVEYDPPSG